MNSNGDMKCELCGKIYLNYESRKLQIEYQMNQHKKRCKKNYMKKRTLLLINFIKEKATDEIKNNILKQYNIISSLELDQSNI